jgi:hypothetical protein
MHMVRNLPKANYLKRLLVRMIKGTNVCRFKHVTATIEERLMSGVMWTSLGNGLLNLIIMSYLSARSKYPNKSVPELAREISNFHALIEGDDGMCRDFPQNENIIADLGIKLKFNKYDNFGCASFCGQVCDPEERRIVADPMRVLRRFFALPRQYVRARDSKKYGLMRAKALSLKYQYPHAPVVGALCDWALDITRGHSTEGFRAVLEAHKVDILVKATESKVWLEKANPSLQSRSLVQNKFGLSISRQIEIERGLVGRFPEMDLTDLLNDDNLWFMRNHVLDACPGRHFEEKVPEAFLAHFAKKPKANAVDRAFKRIEVPDANERLESSE